jgi:hypothetical protein
MMRITMSTQMTDSIAKAVEDYKKVRELLNNSIRVSGKTLAEWYTEIYSFKIPDDLSPSETRKLSVKLIKLNRIVSSFQAMANVRYGSIKESSEWLYREKYNELVATAKATGEGKIPAAAYLDVMARTKTDDVTQMCMVASVELQFWKDALNYLGRMRKLLENVTMNNAIQNKIEGQQAPEDPHGEDQTNDEEIDIFGDA